MLKRALISLSNKENIISFAKELKAMGIEIISTGGTAKLLKENNIEVTRISQVTGFPECLDGRVKTLHPAIHGGILAKREEKSHRDQLKELNIQPIDMVVVNLYPFKETVLKEGTTLEEAIENIDIGGPTMLRSAAKNYHDVVVISDPADYDKVLQQIKENGEVDLKTRLQLAQKVFSHTAQYDAFISSYLEEQSGKKDFSKTLTLTYEKIQDLRYGENPHQKAAFYGEIRPNSCSITTAEQLHGKQLSFNNINDANAALELLLEYKEPTCVALKHTNPCGVGSGEDLYTAYKKAYECDPVSIFGGIIAFNRKVDQRIAKEICKIFLEIIIAPDYDEEALEILKQKKNIRLLKINLSKADREKDIDVKKVRGGILIQEKDIAMIDPKDVKVVTQRAPSQKELEDLFFAWKAVKHVKSNAIVVAKDQKTLGIGPGQVNRIWAAQQSIQRAGDRVKGAVLASDAFFPFSDTVQAAVKAGITAIIQPGGSIRDQESIEECDKNNIAMVFTGMRHFKH
ncbi:bifunctional phosphoribosylaminoimidazolecarboxamide formyltransferase/IMP cyclohydrolase [Garciella nitratireducens]|uniref:Bifunctional purine biosynthesis protein PurH n=1 Tax=Garciella nitratireducens DSM 15102 TaxID=1121911 RepID=A0A1T4NCX9_9FIRM|nr:bifunctional phosphoribosylaminoimidazolecarboxamide formyltransferase/IMP cyclohydrolase [Garciella nitratireducens]SJZ76963.1 phosphoribosylaminoimidazolecarboxamide formyltransferase / IMP cyclohydrolase [Garciella nitratireducens DSM 15102]